jgi:hypothetical protein
MIDQHPLSDTVGPRAQNGRQRDRHARRGGAKDLQVGAAVDTRLPSATHIMVAAAETGHDGWIDILVSEQGEGKRVHERSMGAGRLHLGEFLAAAGEGSAPGRCPVDDDGERR